MFAEVVDRESLHHYWPQQMDVLVVAVVVGCRSWLTLIDFDLFWISDFMVVFLYAICTHYQVRISGRVV